MYIRVRAFQDIIKMRPFLRNSGPYLLSKILNYSHKNRRKYFSNHYKLNIVKFMNSLWIFLELFNVVILKAYKKNDNSKTLFPGNP